MAAWRVDVLGSEGSGVAPCIALRPQKKSILQPVYLFNCPEGLSRAAWEHRLLRPADGCLAAAFFTGLSARHLGGLTGLLFRMASAGSAPARVVGCRGTVGCLHAYRHFVRWRHPHLIVTETDPEATGTAAPIFSDGNLSVLTIDLGNRAGNWTCRCCHKTQAPTAPPSTRQMPPVPAAQTVQGDRNPIFLHDPVSNTLRQAQTASNLSRRPSSLQQLVGYVCYGPGNVVFAVVDCPTIESIASLVAHPAWKCFSGSCPGTFLLFHFTPRQVVAHPQYQQWLATLPHPQHVILQSPAWPVRCTLHSRPDRAFTASAVERCQRARAHPRWFLGANCRCTRHPGPAGSDNGHTYPQLFQTIKLLQVDSGSAQGLQLEWLDGFGEELDGEGEQNRTEKSADCSQPELVFLGTGCAEPSKHRGNSGILIRCARGNILLDVGEGIAHQFIEVLGAEETPAALQRLELIWISHKHADHCAGLIALLERRAELVDGLQHRPPVTIVAPALVIRWVADVSHGGASTKNAPPRNGASQLHTTHRSARMLIAPLLRHLLPVAESLTSFTVHCLKRAGSTHQHQRQQRVQQGSGSSKA
eukprot:m.338569 g.338569  ORF g.338569 m.338569 type:complete len:587 (+) comp19810_c0_seq39:62-1822(+)